MVSPTGGQLVKGKCGAPSWHQGAECGRLGLEPGDYSLITGTAHPFDYSASRPTPSAYLNCHMTKTTMFQPNRTQIFFSQRKVFSLAPQNRKSHLISHRNQSLGEGHFAISGLCSLILKFSCNLAGIYAIQSLSCRVKFQQQCLYKVIGEGEGIVTHPQPPNSKQEGDRQCCCRVYFSN